jgi:hypothetical protein
MGTWGHKSFDNDSACDYVVEVIDEKGGSYLLMSTLKGVIESGAWTQSYEAERAVAAAELIAIARGCSAPKSTMSGTPDEPDLPSLLGLTTDFFEGEVKVFCEAIHIDEIDELSKVALSALKVVLNESELTRLWSEVGNVPWIESIQDLMRRLKASKV